MVESQNYLVGMPRNGAGSEFCASFWDQISWFVSMNEALQFQESQGVSAWICLQVGDTKNTQSGNDDDQYVYIYIYYTYIYIYIHIIYYIYIHIQIYTRC